MEGLFGVALETPGGRQLLAPALLAQLSVLYVRF